jgi:hypothetical protein
MSTFKLIFISRQNVTEETIKQIKDYVRSVYDDVKNKELNIIVTKINDKTSIEITITPDSQQ